MKSFSRISANGDHAGIFGYFQLRVEDIHDLADVLVAQAVLVAILHKALAGIDHEDAFARAGVFLVQHNDAGGDAGAKKQVGRQRDDALDISLIDDIAA